jgi:hypothetical protein
MGIINATLMFASGEELSGMVVAATLDQLEHELAENMLPPLAEAR